MNAIWLRSLERAATLSYRGCTIADCYMKERATSYFELKIVDF
jgi:hypothetical protein